MRIVLAGAENKSTFEVLLKAGQPSILMSYYYVRKKKSGVMELLRRAKDAGMWVLMDSGAATFFVRFPWLDPRGSHATMFTPEEITEKKVKFEKTGKTLEELLSDIDDYVKAYIEWVSVNKEWVGAYAELDIDTLVGLDKVKEWRKWWLSAGLNPIMTYHSGDWRKEIKEIVEVGGRYLGLSGGADSDWYFRVFQELSSLFTQEKVLVHAWAQTNTETIRTVPFFSVDSSSWLSGAKWGLTFRYGGNQRILTSQKKGIRQEGWAREDCVKFGIEHAKLVADVSSVVNEFNAVQWAKFSQDMLKYTVGAYWLSSEELAQMDAETVEETNLALSLTEGNRTELGLVGKEDARLGMPRFCNSCYLGARCPFFERDTTCSIMRLGKVGQEDVGDLRQMLAGAQLERVMHALMAEKIMGGHADEKVSKEMDRLISLLNSVQGIPQMDSVTVKGPGLIERLFKRSVEREQPEIIEAKVVKDE